MKKAIKISILSTLIASCVLSIIGYKNLDKEQLEKIKKIKMDKLNKLKYKEPESTLSPEDIEFLKRVKENKRKRQLAPEIFIVDKKQ